jgi:aryl-alcohol dehydrogenase-like predicted oxidoreductase
MQTRQLGSNGPWVSSMGLGCMGMTPIYATPDPDEAIATIHAAVDAGITMIDTADMYAGGKNEELVGRGIKGIRERVMLASKFGNMRLPDGTRKVNGNPEYVFEACDKALARLGVDHIDLYYLHRMDPTVPIEDTVGAMAQLIEQGKVGAIGLSEAGANTIRRAHATHPLAAVQTEYSLASRAVEAEILPTCHGFKATTSPVTWRWSRRLVISRPIKGYPRQPSLSPGYCRVAMTWCRYPVVHGAVPCKTARLRSR